MVKNSKGYLQLLSTLTESQESDEFAVLVSVKTTAIYVKDVNLAPLYVERADSLGHHVGRCSMRLVVHRFVFLRREQQWCIRFARAFNLVERLTVLWDIFLENHGKYGAGWILDTLSPSVRHSTMLQHRPTVLADVAIA